MLLGWAFWSFLNLILENRPVDSNMSGQIARIQVLSDNMAARSEAIQKANRQVAVVVLCSGTATLLLDFNLLIKDRLAAFLLCSSHSIC